MGIWNWLREMTVDTPSDDQCSWADEGTFPAKAPTRICECRICGTTVSSDDGVCPVCNSTEIGEYSIR